MVKAPQKKKEPKKPVIFLFLSALMVLAAILAYAYEDVLYIYRPYTNLTFHTVNVYFIIILLVSLVGAFFFLFCYLNPRLGNKLLGRGEPVIPKAPPERAGTVTYNVFHDTTAASVKSQNLRRKSARHARRKYAQATRDMKTEEKKKK